MGNVVATLRELGDLVARYGLDHDAEYLMELAAIYGKDRGRFREEMSSPNMWGGAGSVVDMGPRSGTYTDEEQSLDDQFRFFRLIVSLVDELKQEGLATDRALAVADAFRRMSDRQTP